MSLIYCIYIYIYIYHIYTTWTEKSWDFWMKTSVFWAKLYLFLKLPSREYTWCSDFPTFRCPFCSTKRPSLRNTPWFPWWLPHSMCISFPGAIAWEQIIVAGGQVWRIQGEQPIRIVIWPSLSRTCVTMRYRDGTEWRRKLRHLNDCSL